MLIREYFTSGIISDRGSLREEDKRRFPCNRAAGKYRQIQVTVQGLGDVGPNSPLFEQGQNRAAVTSDGHRRVERNGRGSYTTRDAGVYDAWPFGVLSGSKLPAMGGACRAVQGSTLRVPSTMS